MKLISKFNKGIRFLLCVVDMFSKYAWVFPLKDEKGLTIFDTFQKILIDSVELCSTDLDSKTRIPNKIWVDKES